MLVCRLYVCHVHVYIPVPMQPLTQAASVDRCYNCYHCRYQHLQTKFRGSNLGIILGTTFGIASVLIFVCGIMIALVKNFICSQSHSSNVPPRVQQTSTTYSYLLNQPPTVNSSLEATSTFTGIPHSTVPLESELQNAPPPDYSTAHQYPVYTQPDEATSQNKSEEPTAEAPPSYDEEPIKEPPPPYLD